MNPKPTKNHFLLPRQAGARTAIIALLMGIFLGGTASLQALTEQQKINLLYQEIRSSQAIFIRNGIEYDAEKAVSHLKRKHDYAGDKIQTARQFIKYLATESSMTGIAYKIKLPGGKVVESGPYLLQVLKKIESENPE